MRVVWVGHDLLCYLLLNYGDVLDVFHVRGHIHM